VAINKNFVVKNGFEASTDLILADADTRKVGIGTTRPERELQVAGGIGATNFYLTGIGTFVDELNVGLGGTVLTVLGLGNSIGVGTALPAYLLDIRSPVSTGQTALYVQGDVRITGDIQADDVTFDDAEIQDLTVTDTFIVAGLSTFNSNVFINAALNVSGITTLGSYVDINDSVDISVNLNVVGLSTLGGYVDINNSVDISNALNVGGLTTFGGYVDINNSVDISNNLNVSGIATLATISVVGAALSNLIVTGVATISTGIITNLSGTNLNYSGVGTITNLRSTSFNNSGIGTITTLNSTNGTITNLTGTAGTITTLNSTNGTITNLSGTNSNYSGISTALRFVSTVSNGTAPLTVGSSTIVTNLNADLLDGQNGSYYNDLINSTGTLPDARFTGTYTGVSFNSTGIATFASFSGSGASLTTLNATNISSGTLNNARLPSNISVTNLNITGVSTLGTVRVSSGIITATSGIVTYYGDGTYLNLTNNPIKGVGIRTEGSVLGFGVTFIDFRGAGVSTTFYNSNVGIATIFFEGGGSGTIGIGTEFPLDPENGDLFYSAVYGRIFVYYDESVIGVGTDAFWVDAAPFDLSGSGSTIFDDNTTNQEFFPLFTDITTGKLTSSGISTSKLSYNPSTGTLTAVDLNSTSDINLKTNIKTVENALETVDSLRGVSFDWKETGKSSYGVIAQELEEVLPELVKNGEIKSVNYNGIIGVLIEAVKQLKKEVEELKNTK
jgi:hypothetical protein